MKHSFRQIVLNIFFLSLFLVVSCKKDSENNTSPGSGDSDWQELGGENSFPNSSTIYDIKADAEGHIYATGAILQEIAVWNGNAWAKLGNVGASPFTGGVYWPMTVDGAGNVYAVGRINKLAANSEIHVAKWVKSTNTWVNLTVAGHPFCSNAITAITTDASNNVYVAANTYDSSSLGRGHFIGKWNGSSWNLIADSLPMGDNVHLLIDQSNDLYATIGLNSNFSPYIAKWTGSGWQELGGTNMSNFGTGQITALCNDPQGNIYAAGHFVNNTGAYNIVKWTKSTNSLSFPRQGVSLSGFAYAIVSDNEGNIYAGGDFTDDSGVSFVAKWDGNYWSKVGNLNANKSIRSVCIDGNGKVYAGGDFTNKSNYNYIAYYTK